MHCACAWHLSMVCAAAVAYHLALQGYGHEVVLLEQDRFVVIFVHIFPIIANIFFFNFPISFLKCVICWLFSELAAV